MKPKKTAEELVQMLHDEKGIQFHLISEEQAVECFSQRNNYLRTASYRKNYPKHIAGPNAGKYIHLEFAYLTELSTLDFYLRELLLQMCIDVEHDLIDTPADSVPEKQNILQNTFQLVRL